MSDIYDVTIIGAGPAGAAAAKRAAACGARVALIEKEHPGGTCLNWGCIPTKAILKSVHLYADMKRAEEFGITVEGLECHLDKIIERKESIVSFLRGGNQNGIEKQKLITYIKGSGFILSPTKVKAKCDDGDRDINTKKIIIASGSRSKELPMMPFDGKRILDAKQILQMKKMPKSLVIIGGGAIGCEFADMFCEMGVDVTIVELADRLLPMEDSELGKRLALSFKKKGIRVCIGDPLKDAVIEKQVVKVMTESGTQIEADIALVAIGRTPNTDKIGIENLDLELQKGFIPVNEYCETALSGVYAIGDVINTPLLAHVAMQEGRITGYNVTHGNTIKIDYAVIPSCIFTEPEIASLGMTIEKAKEKGINARQAKELFSANGKAHCDGAAEGFVKLIYDADSGVIIGGQIMGPSAADIICEIGLAVSRKCTLRELAFTMHQHPTTTEAIQDAALNAFFSMGCIA